MIFTHNAWQGNLRCTQVSLFFVCKLIHLAINLFHTRNEIPEGLENYKSSTPSFFVTAFLKGSFINMHCFQKCPLDVIKPFDPLFMTCFPTPETPTPNLSREVKPIPKLLREN